MALRQGALAVLGLAALAGCGSPVLPEGQYLGQVAARRSVTVETKDGPVPAWEWTVKLDGGKKTTVVQGGQMFSMGERVLVTTEPGPPRMAIP